MAPLTLTILGASPAAPNPGGACSGYLLREGETAVLMDCGPGTAGRIPLHVPVNSLRAAAISHLHPDHYFDLVQVYYMLKFGERRPAELSPRVPLFMPPGGRDFLRSWGKLVADCETDVGGLPFTFHAVQHYIMSHAMRVQSSSGAVLAFSSDVAPCPQLIETALNADLFLCESAMLDGSQDEQNPALRGHMSAAEAGAAAREAGARRLLLTHYRSGEKYDAHHLAAARGTFDGPVDLAREGQTYVVG
jgi:ribonuclease BN (tRNA processing enzyme)